MSIFEKLAKVDPNKSAEKKITDTVRHVREEGSVLDNIKTPKQRIADKKESVEVIYLDDVTVKALQKDKVKCHEFLTKLNDSQKEEFLSKLEAQRVKDDETKDYYQLSTLNTLIQNLAFIPNDLNYQSVVNYVDSANVTIDFPFIEFAEGIMEGSVEKDLIEEYQELMQDSDIKTTIGEIIDISINSQESQEFTETDLDEESLDEMETDVEQKLDDSVTVGSLIKTYNHIKDNYISKGFKAREVNDSLISLMSKRIKQIEKFNIQDDIIKKLEELEPKDNLGNKIEPEENKPPLVKLEEALAAYIEGNDEPLKELTKSEELDEEVKDCASHILKPTSETNKAIDKLQDKVETLRKYNFKVSEIVPLKDDISMEGTVPETPLTRNEYYTMYETPGYLYEMAKCPQQCLPINQFEVQSNGCITTNQDGICQNWIPIMGSVMNPEELQSMSNSDILNVVNDKYVLRDSFIKAAVQTNNLAELDNKFYKQRLSDCGWAFDEVPQCLSEVEGIQSGKVYPKWCQIPADVPTIPVIICGMDYNLLLP